MKTELFTVLAMFAFAFWAGSYVENNRIHDPIVVEIPVESPESLGVFQVTAYCATCEICIDVEKWRDGKTASGHVIAPGDRLVAAPPEIPFGTILSIPGYGEAVPVLDRGGSIKNRRLDVLFTDQNGVSGHQRALEWGIQWLEIRQISD